MKYLMLVNFFMGTVVYSSDVDTQSAKKSLTFTQSVVVGGLVGAAEVALPGQMLSYAMNRAVEKKPFVLRNSYAGFVMNAGAQMPTVAVQTVVKTTLSEADGCDSHSLAKAAGVSYVAGVAGALVDTPANAVQLYMQNLDNAGKTTLQACRALGKRAFRGFSANAFCKEAPFAVGYQVLAGKCDELVGLYVGKGLVSAALGGTVAGVVTAVATQPGAVVRNKMQADVTGAKYPTTWHAFKKVVHEEGARALWRGLPQRGARVMVAVPLYTGYSGFLKQKLTE
jgi:hypothetical protein